MYILLFIYYYICNMYISLFIHYNIYHTYLLLYIYIYYYIYYMYILLFIMSISHIKSYFMKDPEQIQSWLIIE